MTTCYQFNKLGCVIRRPVGMNSPGPYYTTIVDMKSVVDFPFSYAMYFSTDHDKGDGGVWLYVSNGKSGDMSNWISYDEALVSGSFDYIKTKPSGNPIFKETTQGRGHTETPHANVIDGKVYMTYHKDHTGHTQATLLATSIDGVNFCRINGDHDSIVLNYDITKDVGNGHTGYFRWSSNIFSGIDFKYVGYSLHGGGNDYFSAIWGSNNAIKWERLHILKPIEGHGVPEDKLLIWHEMDPLSIRKISDDEYVGVCAVGNRASGAAKRISELYEVYLGADGVSLKRDCKPLLFVGDNDALDSEELASPVVLEENGQYFLFYVGASENGSSNHVMFAEGQFKASDLMGDKKSVADQKKHVVG